MYGIGDPCWGRGHAPPYITFEVPKVGIHPNLIGRQRGVCKAYQQDTSDLLFGAHMCQLSTLLPLPTTCKIILYVKISES